MNSKAGVISWLFTPVMLDLDKHGNGYGIQVLTHSRSEPFDAGRISMKFHSQQIKDSDHCRDQYVPCLRGLLRFAQCLAYCPCQDLADLL